MLFLKRISEANLNIWTFLTLVTLSLCSLVLDWPLLFIIAIAVFLLRILGIRNQSVFLVISIVVYCIFDQEFFYGAENFLSTALYLRVELNLPFQFSGFQVALVIMSTLGINFALFRISKFLTNDYFIQVLIFLVFCFGIIAVSKIFLDQRWPAFTFVVAGTLMFTKVFNYSIFALKQIDQNVSFLKYSSLVHPTFWDNSLIPRPTLNLDDWEKDDLEKMDRQSFQFTLLVLFSTTVVKLLFLLLWRKPFWGLENLISFEPIPYYRITGINYIINTGVDRWKVLISFWGTSFQYIFEILIIGLLWDACYRLLNFKGTTHFMNPFKARTFGEFFTCITPFYVNFLLMSFVFPMYNRTRNLILDKKLRFRVCLCVGIVVVGFLHHLIRDLNMVHRFGLMQAIRTEFVISIFYCGIISYFVVFFPLNTTNHKWPIKIMIVIFWFLLYALILSIRSMKITEDLATKFDLYLYLIGLK